ncbi:MAG TPA: helix-turn-helix domain-containing protein [Candidatus Limnocylindrales bacterium]|nr:helix-turn-helix domain-containing protein [Candidatus Limnocylindrales bacterium]
MSTTAGRSLAQVDRPLAESIGGRLRTARLKAGLTQQQLAGERYTKAYVSALEHGLAKPSVAALNYLCERLGVAPTSILADRTPLWTRLEADLRLVAGDWAAAAEAFGDLLASVTETGVRAELALGLAEALCRLDRADEAVSHAAEAAELFRNAGRVAEAGLATYWQAAALHQLDNAAEARSLLRTLLDAIRDGLPVAADLRARVLVALAAVESRAGKPGVSVSYLEEARSLAAAFDGRRRATFLHALANGYRDGGDIEAAITAATQAIGLYRAADAEREWATLENDLALAHLALGHLERAREHAGSAHAELTRLGDDRLLAHVIETQAQIELAAGQPDRARELAEAALQQARASGNHKSELSASLSLARAQRAMGNRPSAAATLETAILAARAAERPAQLRVLLEERAELAAEDGDLKLAYDLTREALQHNPA